MIGVRTSGGPRANALWGRGGRGLAIALGLLALGATSAAAGTSGSLATKRPLSSHARLSRHGYVTPSLLRLATRHPNRKVRVIIQSADGAGGAASAFDRVDRLDTDNDSETLGRRLGVIGAVSAIVEANKLPALRRIRGLIVTVDAPVHVSGYSSKQLWPYEAGLAKNWDMPAKSAPTIAVVDSGIQDRADFAGRLVASVNLASRMPNSPGDGRGHGTFVAGIAAGAASGYAGAAPTAKLASIDVMDDNGVALTSDVIAACSWILANKDAYNIRVANFSLHSSNSSNFTRDPLDRAVEKLWFNGVVVVAAAGNYGTTAGPSGVKYAPGNDPFVLTVGAIDIGGTKNRDDDTPAPWSAYGRTNDGFAKPELAAPGRYMLGPVPAGSTLAVQRADKLVAPDYIQLSGTSFAAPAVAGAAAQILMRHPEYTPDEVKGALMLTAKPVDRAPPLSVGVGELQAGRAPTIDRAPNPNKGLDRFLRTDPLTGAKSFDAVSWLQAAKTDVSWNDVSYDATAWASVSWDVVSWEQVSYDAVSYSDVSYSDVSYSDVSYLDVSYEDAAEGDTTTAASGDLLMTPLEQLAILADPELAPTTP